MDINLDQYFGTQIWNNVISEYNKTKVNKTKVNKTKVKYLVLQSINNNCNINFTSIIYKYQYAAPS